MFVFVALNDKILLPILLNWSPLPEFQTRSVRCGVLTESVVPILRDVYNLTIGNVVDENCIKSTQVSEAVQTDDSAYMHPQSETEPRKELPTSLLSAS